MFIGFGFCACWPSGGKKRIVLGAGTGKPAPLPTRNEREMMHVIKQAMVARCAKIFYFTPTGALSLEDANYLRRTSD